MHGEQDELSALGRGQAVVRGDPVTEVFPVFEALPLLGFAKDKLGLTLRHPQCELGAAEVYMPPAGVWFNGSYNHDGRSMGFLEFNLPLMVESLDQLKAFLAYYLRDAITRDVPSWIVEGKALRTLLPWERQLAAYAARDRCSVNRDWFRIALKEFREALRGLDPTDLVKITFDGTVLKMECGHTIAMPAQGRAWNQTYQVQAVDLSDLPRRLMNRNVELSIWDHRLCIDRCCYRLAAASPPKLYT